MIKEKKIVQYFVLLIKKILIKFVNVKLDLLELNLNVLIDAKLIKFGSIIHADVLKDIPKLMDYVLNVLIIHSLMLMLILASAKKDSNLICL